MQKHKVVIIGSGIAGMTSAIYLKRAGIDTLIIENNAPGGKLNIIPSIENYPGFESIEGPELAMNIYKQVKKLDINILFKNIDNIDNIDLDNKIINNEIEFDYLIIATGRNSKLLNIDGEEELIGKGISTCALCDGVFYKDKKVVLVGGANSALTESLYLSNICSKVTVIVRKDKFKGEDYLINKVLKKDNIKVIYNSNIISYNKKDSRLVSVTLDNDEIISCDGVFLAIGSTPNSSLFNVKKENNYIIVDSKNKTNIDYVYAVGDIIKKDIYQLVTASYDGLTAANDIIKREK